MNDWHIQSRSHACQSCAREFEHGQPYHTILLNHKQEFLRSDICPKCFEKEYGGNLATRQNFVSHWMGTFEVPPPPAPDAIQKDTAESLLRKLCELNDPQYLAATYILAVMLERKRILRVKEQIRSGGHRTFIYEHPKTGDIFSIPDAELQLDQLESVQKLVAHLLEHGLTPMNAALESASPSPDATAAPASAEASSESQTTGAPDTHPESETPFNSNPTPSGEELASVTETAAR